jgi:hypothetical protein
MQRFLICVALVCTAGLWARAQNSANGTWQMERTGSTPSFSLFLRVDGRTVTGLVSRCASAQSRPTDIRDGRFDGNTLTFTCTSGDHDRTVSFTGTLMQDTITFMWERHVRPGGLDNGAVDPMFGPSAARQFTVKRAPDGALAKSAGEVRGSEFAAALNVAAKDAKTEAVLFVPDKVRKVRTVIAPIDYGNGHGIYDAAEWRKLAENVDAALLRIRFSSISSPGAGLGAVNFAQDGADVLLASLRRMAEESGFADVATAPVLLWGHSGGGGVASLLTGTRPERVLAFVRYHSGPIGGDLRVISKVPCLLVSGGQDATAPPAVAEGLWKSGRAIGAPWTFAIHAEAVHGDLKDLAPANKLMINWATSVIHHRLPPGAKILADVTESSGWLGDNRTGAIAPYASFAGEKTTASWLPDEPTARAWHDLHVMSK